VSRGLGYMVGIVTGVAAMMVLVATGPTELMLALPGAAPVTARPPSIVAGFFPALSNPKSLRGHGRPGLGLRPNPRPA
jgi:hypothetical protein